MWKEVRRVYTSTNYLSYIESMNLAMRATQQRILQILPIVKSVEWNLLEINIQGLQKVPER